MSDADPFQERLRAQLGEPSPAVVAAARQELAAAISSASQSGIGLSDPTAPAVVAECEKETIASKPRTSVARRLVIVLSAAAVILTAFLMPAMAFRHRSPSTGGPLPVAKGTVTTTTLSSKPVMVAVGCSTKADTPLESVVTSISPDGRTSWSERLPDGKGMLTGDVPAKYAGGLGFISYLGVIHVLDMANGRAVWSFQSGGEVLDMWIWNHELVVVSESSPKAATRATEITVLDERTGSIEHRTSIEVTIDWDQLLLPNGNVAWLTVDGTLQVIDPSTGMVEWSRQESAVPNDQGSIFYADGVLVAVQGSDMFGLSPAAGEVLWETHGLSENTQEQLTAGEVVVYNTGIVDHSPALWAVDPRSGKVLWRFGATPGVSPGVNPPYLGYVQWVSGGPAGLLLYTTQSDELYSIEPRTGTIAWQVSTLLANDSPSFESGDNVVEAETSFGNAPTFLVDRSAQTGRVIWRRLSSTYVETIAGGLIIGDSPTNDPVQYLSAYRLSDGALAWRRPLDRYKQGDYATVSNDGGQVVTQLNTQTSGCGLAR